MAGSNYLRDSRAGIIAAAVHRVVYKVMYNRYV